MSIADRIDPEDYETLEEFLLAHEIKNIALDKLLAFTKKAAKSSCCLVCDCLPCDALELLREFGEVE